MINFSRGFADEASLDTVDTEKSRVITHRAGTGMGGFSRINLTKVPLPPRLAIKSTTEPQEERYEYSSRELKPAPLLLRDLLRAHSIFLLHHDTSLSALFVRSKRTKFTAVLGRYWDLFLSTWNVMLHGNPARNIFGGINIAASGELGVGVGEEDRGSGEREVLEGLVGRIEGLVDLVVSKFGTEDQRTRPRRNRGPSRRPALVGDGRGTCCRGRRGILGHRRVEQEVAEGWRRARKRRGSVEQTEAAKETAPANADEKHQKQTGQNQTEQHKEPEHQNHQQPKEQQKGRTTSIPKNNCPKIGLRLNTGPFPAQATSTRRRRNPAPPNPLRNQHIQTQRHTNNLDIAPQIPQALIIRRRPWPTTSSGLKGSISEPPADSESSSASSTHNNSRTLLRTINIELDSKYLPPALYHDHQGLCPPRQPPDPVPVAGNFLPGYTSHDLNKSEKLRVVVYVNRPFIFTFFFQAAHGLAGLDALYTARCTTSSRR
ncbi:hypothetical protein J3459_006063 [Metarhizium acridum]|nr:hypothetical protein J3459_006063 [Metarhizium acridum]